MGTVNKIRLREEVDLLKQEFEQLCSAGKVSSEIRVLVNSLLVVVELILSIFLEKTTRKGNKNSSIPSSQTEKTKPLPSTAPLPAGETSQWAGW